MSRFAWVTLATNDSYSLGALVVAHSLKRVHTPHQLAVLITPGVSEAMKNKLRSVFNVVEEVNLLDSKDDANLALLKRPELGITFTKLHCWRLVQFEKCVFLDADTLVLRNCDELFEREELSAAPDVGWPDCFNSGVYVYRPSLETFSSLLQFAVTNGSFDGGDQGLLNSYFSDWASKDISKHLPFVYNTSSVATYSYLPAFKQFGQNTKILHFIGTAKPWLQNFNSETRKVYVPGGYQHLANFLQFWWDIFCEDVHSRLSTEMSDLIRNNSGLAGALSQLHLGEPKSGEQEAYEEHMRRQCWEQGNIDYMGRDSFDNIWRRIQETLKGTSQEEPDVEPAPAPAPVPVRASPPRRHSSKSRSRSTTPKRDPRDRSPTPQPEDSLPLEKKEVQIEATIHEEDDGLYASAQDERSVERTKLPPPVQYDPTTRTTTLTKKVFAGNQQVKTPQGKTRTAAKAVYDPSVDDDVPAFDTVTVASVTESKIEAVKALEPTIVPINVSAEPIKPVGQKQEKLTTSKREPTPPPPPRTERKPSPPRLSPRPQMQQQVAQESMAGKAPTVEPVKSARRRRVTPTQTTPQSSSIVTSNTSTTAPVPTVPSPSKPTTVPPKTTTASKSSQSTNSSTNKRSKSSKSSPSVTTTATINAVTTPVTCLNNNHQPLAPEVVSTTKSSRPTASAKSVDDADTVPLTANDELQAAQQSQHPAAPPRRKRESKTSRLATITKKSTLMNLFFSCITCTKRKDVK
ncbi:mucin-2 isoform X8 [Wyeomyia smithii]|uniref:mucin-2 isoform X8 n=1 Tax=Wyeomyia smithii TaxID=174621 RepID=UPI0024680711|nr:mucin-2 isoform X8 [Wyeomyia smithii]